MPLIPTVLENGVPLLSSPSSLSLNTGPISSSQYAKSQSPTSKHFKTLPGSVKSVDAANTAEVALYLTGNPNVLIVDIRTFNSYSVLRLRHAYNVCVPTTLLKRPSYDLVQIINTSSLPADQKAKISSHSTPMTVLVYDPASTSTQLSFSLYQTISKFLKYECFSVAFLEGGMLKVDDLLIDHSCVLPLRTPVSPVTPKSAGFGDWQVTMPSLTVEQSPFLSGFTLPSATASHQKLLMSMKKNLPRLDTTAGYAYKFRLPEKFAEKRHLLPNWLAFLAENYGMENHNASIITALSDKFNKLEKSEQARLSMAISKSNKGSQNQSPQHSSDFCSPLSLCPCCDKIDYTIPKGIEFGYKNRYNNIWPYEHSRVKLISSPSCANKSETSDDYFNANYIACDQISDTRYIATQNPLDSTYEDFWNTIWYNGVKGIVCLNNPLLMTPRTYYHGDQYFDKSKLKIEVGPCDQREGYSIREITLTKRDVSRKILHFAYSEWPDFGTPDNFNTVVEMMHTKNKLISSLQTFSLDWDLLVHCSAGCGRTGCFITLDMVVGCFEQPSKKSLTWGNEDLVYKSVQFQRQQRIAMVQNLDQFIYCYECILSYLVEELL